MAGVEWEGSREISDVTQRVVENAIARVLGRDDNTEVIECVYIPPGETVNNAIYAFVNRGSYTIELTIRRDSKHGR